MALARWGLRVAGEDEIPIKGIRKIRVGIYEVEEIYPLPARSGAAINLELPGWEPIVRMNEDGENVIVMVRQDQDRIRGLLVVVDDFDELIIVRMWGRLDRMLREALRYGFDEIDRPELFEPALENSTIELEGSEPPETAQGVSKQA